MPPFVPPLWNAPAGQGFEASAAPAPAPAPILPSPVGIAPGSRIRKSPFYNKVVAAGVKSFTVYNHMLLPAVFDAEREYWALVNDCALWDVSAQRQMSIIGPDAEKLANLLTTRELRNLKNGFGYYAVICDYEGVVVNDPVCLKYGPERFDFSLADSDVFLLAHGLQHALRLDAVIQEQNTSTLALQGPKSRMLLRDLMAGDPMLPMVEALKWFEFLPTIHLDGIPVTIMRAGWSPEFGYELLMNDPKVADAEHLWDLLMTAGAKYGITPGAPNQARRLEGGMLSVGGDTKWTRAGGVDVPEPHNALELGLPKRMVNLAKDDFIGRDALIRKEKEGVQRTIVGVTLDRAPQSSADCTGGYGRGASAEPLLCEGRRVGEVTSRAVSPRMGQFIGLATVNVAQKAVGTKLELQVGHELIPSTVAAFPLGGLKAKEPY